jgi:hypothetical protein
MAPTPTSGGGRLPDPDSLRPSAREQGPGQAAAVRSSIPPARHLGAEGEQGREVTAIDRGALGDG